MRRNTGGGPGHRYPPAPSAGTGGRSTIIEALGPLPVMEVLKAIRDIQAANGNPAAHTALVVANKVFDLAAVGLDDPISPCTGVKPEHYQIKKEGEGDRNRILDDAEIVKVWNAAGSLDYKWSPIYRLLMLLGLRREEISSIEWEWIDFDNRVLNIPSSKGGIPLTVPLSDRCLSILRSVPRIHEQTSVFGTTSSWSLAKCKLDASSGVKDWRSHDLRRTMRSGLARLKTPVVVAEMCLGHKQGGIVGIYDRHQYLDERREALLKWEQFVLGLVDPASKVVPLRA